MSRLSLLLCLVAATACSSSSDPLVNDFVATLDTQQEVPAAVVGVDIEVVATNLAPANGTFQTPVWIGFHNGTFDIYDRAAAANLFFPTTNALERIAEDGTVDPLNEAFTAAGAGTMQATLAGSPTPPLDPAEVVRRTMRIDPNDAASRYFSYASMVIPSNDAFVANGSPLAHAVFDAAGNFVFNAFTVLGNEVLDAGTEVNDELPANTAFFGQAAPDTGVVENGTVELHPGFMAAGNGGILDDAMFAAADFTVGGYETLRFEIAIVDNAPVAPTGTATATLNGNDLTITINATNLSGPFTVAHIHEGAVGVAGPVAVDIASSITQTNGTLTANGTFTLTDDQVAALRAGNLYFNIHTALNPAGEIRGQIVAAP